jgi:hypothetical protein
LKYQNDEDSSSDSESEEVKMRRARLDRKQVEGKATEQLETVLNGVVAVVSLH